LSRAAFCTRFPITILGTTASDTKRAVEFDRERLEVVKRHFGDIELSAITRELIEGFQAKRRLEGASNRNTSMRGVEIKHLRRKDVDTSRRYSGRIPTASPSTARDARDDSHGTRSRVEL